MPKEDSGTKSQVEHSEDDFDLDTIDLGVNRDDEGDEELNDDDGDPGEKEQEVKKGADSYESRYKELQKTYGASREEVKGLKGKLTSIEQALEKHGGLEKVAQVMNYITSDPDFVDLATKKQRGEHLGIDESKLDPKAKEALNLVRRAARAEIAEYKREVEAKLDKLKSENIVPFEGTVQEMQMEKIALSMNEKYGPDWAEYLDTMDRLGGFSSKPNFKEVENVFLDALREEGKFDSFMQKQAEKRVEQRKSKSVTRTKSADTTPAKKSGKAGNMVEAARRAARRLQEAG